MQNIGLGERALSNYRNLKIKVFPLYTRRRLAYDWFLGILKKQFDLDDDEPIGEKALLRYRRIKNALLPVDSKRRAVYEQGVNRFKRPGDFMASEGFPLFKISHMEKGSTAGFNKKERVYLRLNSDGMGDVINLVPLIHAILDEYPGCVIITNQWKLPFGLVSNKCTSIPDGKNKPAGNVNYFDFSDKINFHMYCPNWIQFFISAGMKPKPLFKDPFPLLPEKRGIRFRLQQRPYVVMHARSERTGWQGRQTGPANIKKIIEHLHKEGISTVEVGNNIDQVHPKSISFIDNSSLEDLLYLIKNATGFAGVDSLPMHIAALYRKPVLGFFGATQPLSVLPNSMPIVKVGNEELDCLGCVYERRLSPNVSNLCQNGGAQCETVKPGQVEKAIDIFDRWIGDKKYFERLVEDSAPFYTDFLSRMGNDALDANRYRNWALKHIDASPDETNGLIRNYGEIKEFINDPEHDRIALFYRGGIGDTLLLYWMANAVRTQFPDARIFLFPSDRNVKALKNMVCFMNKMHVVDVRNENYLHSIQIVETRFKFDLVFDCRYVMKVTSPSKKYQKIEKRLSYQLERFNFNFNRFPLGNNLHNMHGLPLLEVLEKTADIKLESYHMTIPLSPEDFNQAKDLKDISYITLSTGFDSSFRLKKITKQWSKQNWEELIRKIAVLGVKTIQLGTNKDAPLKGAIDLRGKTSLREAASIIKDSICNISVEGGLVWLAKAVQSRSIVLFGPTDKGFFGFSENVNLSADLPCSPCWWKTDKWIGYCPEGYRNPKCMEQISPDMVFNQVRKIVHENASRPGFKYRVEDLSFFSSGLIARNGHLLKELYLSAQLPIDKENKNIQNNSTGVYIHGSKHWEYSYALQYISKLPPGRNGKLKILDVGSGRGAIHRWLLQKGYDVILADINFGHPDIWLESAFLANRPPSLKIAFNSIFNISFPQGSFDIVLCFSVVEHIKEKPFAIKELLRVLKDGGRLIMTFDFASQKAWQDDVNDAFGKDYRVEVFNEVNLPSVLNEAGIDFGSGLERMLDRYAVSASDMEASSVEGIPAGMTVGGLIIKKTKKE